MSKKSKTNFDSNGNSSQKEELENVWKVYGRDTEVGRMLHTLYKTSEPPKINYPKPKQKAFEIPKKPAPKPCPQKTQIEYPSLNPKASKPIPMIYFAPKRRPFEEIKAEIDKFYSTPQINPMKPGQDRNKLKVDLISNFKNNQGILPKGLDRPRLSQKEIDEIRMEVEEKRLRKEEDKLIKDLEISEKKEGGVQKELDQLFNAITEEIEERQKYLEEIEDLDAKDLKAKVKKEIIERFAELQKVLELKKQYSKK